VDALIAVLIFSGFHTSVNIIKPRTLSWLSHWDCWLPLLAACYLILWINLFSV